MTIAVYDASQAGLAGARSVLLRGMLPMVREGAAQTWVDVAFEGTWRGHRAGEFSFTREVFEEIVANFKANPNPVPLDYEHATEMAGPAPAAGWVQGVEVRNVDGVAHLFALVEFTDEAAQWVREGRYRFSSAVVDFRSRDLQSGEQIGAELLSLALTNVPFIRGQAPIRLSRRSSPIALNEVTTMKIDKAELIRRIRKLEGDEVSPEQVGKLAQSMALLDEAMGGGESEPAPDPEPAEEPSDPAAMSTALADDPDPAPDAPPAEPVAAADDEAPAEPAPETEAQGLLEQAMEALGLDLPGLVEVLKGLLSGGDESAATMPLSAKTALTSKISGLEEQVKLREDKIKVLSAQCAKQGEELGKYREREADEAVDLLVASGRLLDDAKPRWRKLYLSNREQFDELAAGLPEIVPVGGHAASQTPPTEATPAIDEDDPWVKERRRVLSTTWLRNDPKALNEAIRRELAIRNKNNGVRV